jgi:PAS domain S-box-containing protein
VIVAFSETVELILAYKLVKKSITHSNIYNSVVQLTKFLVITLLISAISATIVTFITSLSGNRTVEIYLIIWLKWIMGHMLSYILISPLILFWKSTSFENWSAARFIELACVLLSIVVISQIIFGNTFSAALIFLSPYFLGPFLLWSIIRFSNKAVSLVLLIITLIAVINTVNGNGPFYGESFEKSQILLQGFLLFLYTATHLLYASITELKEARNDLRLYKEDLEELVDERAEEIRMKNEKLLSEIEERKKTEIKLRELSEAVEQSPVSVIITDKRGSIEYANPKFIDMKGYPLEEILGNNPRMFKSGLHDAEFYNRMWNTILSGKTWRGEIQNRKKSGEIFWESASISPLLNENGEIIQLIGIYEDISQQKKAAESIKEYVRKLSESEERLREMNLNKDRFFSIIAHDLKSPFSSLLGFSEFLVSDFEELSLSEIKHYTQNIHDATKKTYNLLENLLNWSNLQRDKKILEIKKITLDEVVPKITELYSEEARKKGIVLDLSSTSNCEFYADENTISTVLRNLVSNSIKFSKEGDIIRIFCQHENGKINISVSDTGIGMSQEDLEKLFRIDIHHSSIGTANERGTGLGLILCKELVEKNNGKIRVESKLGKGTTFTISIPKGLAH